MASLRRRPLGHRGSSFAETSGRNLDFRPVRESSGGHRRQLRVRIADDGSVHPASVDVRQLHGVASEAAAQENKTGQNINLNLQWQRFFAETSAITPSDYAIPFALTSLGDARQIEAIIFVSHFPNDDYTLYSKIMCLFLSQVYY